MWYAFKFVRSLWNSPDVLEYYFQYIWYILKRYYDFSTSNPVVWDGALLLGQTLFCFEFRGNTAQYIFGQFGDLKTKLCYYRMEVLNDGKFELW